MTAFAILDLVIGIIFIYFLLGLFCSSVLEIIAGVIRLRAKTLNAWVRDAFKTGNLGNLILNHKLIDGLTENGRIAAYIPADKFARALLDIVASGNNPNRPYTIETLTNAVQNTDLLSDDFKRVLLQCIAQGGQDIDSAKKFIEGWFNDSMERVTGTYKKKARFVILIISIVTSISLNVDTIALSKFLYAHPDVSKQLANRAGEVTLDTAYQAWIHHIEEFQRDSLIAWTEIQRANEQFERNTHEANAIRAELDSYNLPLGWAAFKDDIKAPYYLLTKIIGIALTALAVSLGAPFWFDVLGKLVSLRAAGPKPNKHQANQ